VLRRQDCGVQNLRIGCLEGACVAVCCSVLQRVTLCCSVLQRQDITVQNDELAGLRVSVLPYVAVRCGVLQKQDVLIPK